MNFSFDDIVKKFWMDYHRASNKYAYKELLVLAKLNILEMMENLEGEEFITFYDNSPVFAMVSEVHRICPEAVTELAEQDNFFDAALNLFSSYSEEKRDLLRDTYLKKPNNLFRYK